MDSVDARMLRICIPSLADYVTHSFNHCVDTPTFSTSWRSSPIKPIPKLGIVGKMKDMRPITILPALSEILQRCVNGQLREFVDSINILPAYQSGFRPGHSCTTASSYVVDNILQATNNRDITVLILLDFSRAFDTVYYHILLQTLRHSHTCEVGYSKLHWIIAFPERLVYPVVCRREPS
ncbi:hypothetical protein Trydic_g14551 [Trypoxylus dichotomus]